MKALSAGWLGVLCFAFLSQSTASAASVIPRPAPPPSPHSVSLPATLPATPDECEFIRHSVSLLKAKGGTYRIPAGTYICQKPIVLDQNHLTLVGELAGLTKNPTVTLKLAGHANAPVIILGDAVTPPRLVEDVEVSNLRIDGNRLEQTMECWGGPCDSGGTAFVRNNGISVRGVHNGRIKNVFITSARSGGVVTERGCKQLSIDGLTSVDNHFDGYAGYETTGAVVANTVLAHNRAAGISIDINYSGNTFQNVLIDTNGDVGVFMRASNHNLFKDVTIRESGNHGLFLAQVENVQSCPTDNEFLNLSVFNSKGYGFRLNDACPRNRLTGTAHFKGNQSGCISQGTDVPLNVEGVLQCEN